jgi:hypothetical protein
MLQLGALACLCAFADTKPQSPEVETVLKLVDAGNLPGATKYLEELPPPAAAQTANDAMTKLYWEHKDLASAMALAKATIDRSLKAAEGLKPKDPKAAEELLGALKPVAYNLASFTWPGWGEPNITITEEDAKQGLEAARLNLRLAQELKRNDHALSQAHWLLGAHLLAQKSDTEPAEAFREAAKRASAAGKRSEELLSRGYLQIVALLQSPTDSSAASELEHIEKELLKLEEGKELVDQLNTARKTLEPLRNQALH